MKIHICDFGDGYVCEIAQPEEKDWKTVGSTLARKLKAKSSLPIPKRFHHAWRLWLKSVMEQMEDDWGIKKGEAKKLFLPTRFYRRQPQQLEIKL